MAKKKLNTKGGRVQFPREVYVRASDDDDERFLWVEDDIEDIRDDEIVAVYELKKIIKAKKSVDWEEIK